MRKITITSNDKKNVKAIIEAERAMDKTNNEQVTIQVSAFKPIQAKFKKAYEAKDKLTLAEMGFYTLATKVNKKGNETKVIDTYLLPQKRISDLYIISTATETEQESIKLESIQNTANEVKKLQKAKKVKAEERKRKNNKEYKIEQELLEADKKYQNLLEADLSFLNGMELIKINQLVSVILKSSNHNFSDIIKHRQSKIDIAKLNNKKLKNEIAKDGFSANVNAHKFKALQEEISGNADLQKYADNAKK